MATTRQRRQDWTLKVIFVATEEDADALMERVTNMVYGEHAHLDSIVVMRKGEEG